MQPHEIGQVGRRYSVPRFAVTASVLKQKAYTLYMFSMSSTTLRAISYVTPRSKDNPEEIQRILNPKRAKEIGEYIKEETSLLPNAIVVSLTKVVEITETGTPNVVTLTFPSQTGKYAYILDGQHRLAGFDYSDAIQFDLPVVALYNASDDLRGKVFADINSKQVEVSAVTLLGLYYQIKALPVERAATMEVVERLAKDIDSPLSGKIKTLDDDKGTWVTNKLMAQVLAPYLENGGSLYKKNPANQTQILKEYFKGVQETWPEAWGDNGHMLTRPMGIQVIMSIFDAVKHRCDLNEGKQYTATTFRRSLEPLVDCNIELPGGGQIPLTWQRGPFGSLNNKAGQVLISKQLKNYLRQADDDESGEE